MPAIQEMVDAIALDTQAIGLDACRNTYSKEEEAVLANFNFDLSTYKDTGSAPDPPTLSTAWTDAIHTVEEASVNGNLSIVEQTLAKQPDLPADKLTYALQLAVHHQRQQIVEYLVSRGAPVGTSSARYATANKDKAALEVFLEHGWDINRPLGSHDPPPLTLVIAEDENFTLWLLSKGADPNAPAAFEDMTPLSRAVRQAPFPTIRMLFEQFGGSVTSGQLLFYALSRDDRLEVLAYLLDKGARINDIKYQNAHRCYNQMQRFSLGTPLHYAAWNGDRDVVTFLLARGANPLIKDSTGERPYDSAERSGHHSLATYLRDVAASASEPLHQFADEQNDWLKRQWEDSRLSFTDHPRTLEPPTTRYDKVIDRATDLRSSISRLETGRVVMSKDKTVAFR
ncbi:hypothetical protein LTR08_004076 [Meristemomyces frigidus]|nr:hypothetical protein LTR08_004076 [Meristemomyces frigidus]